MESIQGLRLGMQGRRAYKARPTYNNDAFCLLPYTKRQLQ